MWRKSDLEVKAHETSVTQEPGESLPRYEKEGTIDSEASECVINNACLFHEWKTSMKWKYDWYMAQNNAVRQGFGESLS